MQRANGVGSSQSAFLGICQTNQHVNYVSVTRFQLYIEGNNGRAWKHMARLNALQQG